MKFSLFRIANCAYIVFSIPIEEHFLLTFETQRSDDDNPTTMPHLIVTASVDEIHQYAPLHLDTDLILAGTRWRRS